ncbi:TPA: hypothetical protein N0F65_003240 [Lagenidium giganteum]|uniref:ABC transporter ATP-binding protein n=1 Tax=Lagenidium giganteum TaxID=4803 RepID=A0AAV2Z8J0_9STRA|nr:TPA: hypothetical protein N0F65_003240 [Lagenidium giganteum]
MDQVLHFERIMLLDGGRVVEIGGVEELLSNPDRTFFEMLETAPLKTSGTLRRICEPRVEWYVDAKITLD